MAKTETAPGPLVEIEKYPSSKNLWLFIVTLVALGASSPTWIDWYFDAVYGEASPASVGNLPQTVEELQESLEKGDFRTEEDFKNILALKIVGLFAVLVGGIYLGRDLFLPKQKIGTQITHRK